MFMRGKFGPAFVMIIMGSLIVIFVFSGVFSPRATRGLHEGAVAGTVNGDAISLTDFNREYTRRIEFFKQMAGGKVSEEQLKMFRIKEGVFSELVNRKLMNQAAVKAGMVPSDEEVRDKIREIPAFQKNGAFDSQAYKEVLAANNMTPSGFENMMRDDLASQAWQRYFAKRVHVSATELRKEFVVAHDRKNVKYVLLTAENGRKGVSVSGEEAAKYLADPAKMNLVKSQYESRKDMDFKGKTLDQAKEAIAKEMIASDKNDEITKINEKLAGQVASAMGSSKASDDKVNAMLKAYGASVKSTGLVSREASYIPGIGEAKDLQADLWKKDSPLEGKAKVYKSSSWMLVAMVSETEKPDLSKMASEEPQLRTQLQQKKERELSDSFVKELQSRAKIDKNPSVVGDEEG